MGDTKIYGRVRAFLKSHPQTSLDMLTSIGYILFDAGTGKGFLDGKQAHTHPRVSEAKYIADADEVLE